MKNRLDSQLAGLQARVQHSQFANMHLQRHEELIRVVHLQTVGVRKSRPFLTNQHVFSIVSLQVHLRTCVNIQLQTGGVRKSRPVLKHQLARLQPMGVGKSRPFLKNQNV